jgi:WD40 repeat protein
MNNVQNAIGFYHLGGWYVDVKNMEIEKAKTHATSDGIKIVSAQTVDPGATGSYGGAYVGTYKNVVARTLNMSSAYGSRVTTMTFNNPDVESVTIANALSITFLQPIVQIASGGSFFTLDNVTGFTAIGGDFEGSGTKVYTLVGTINGLHSINNQIWNAGVPAAYISGSTLIADGLFEDTIPSTEATGIITGYYGGLRKTVYKNADTVETARIGHHYVGNEFTICNNGIKISDNTITLDNVSLGGSCVSWDISGRTKVQQSSPHSNPAPLDNVAIFDNGGEILTLQYTYENNGAAIAGGLTTGRFYKTSTGVLMIVY